MSAHEGHEAVGWMDSSPIEMHTFALGCLKKNKHVLAREASLISWQDGALQ